MPSTLHWCVFNPPIHKKTWVLVQDLTQSIWAFACGFMHGEHGIVNLSSKFRLEACILLDHEDAFCEVEYWSLFFLGAKHPCCAYSKYGVLTVVLLVTLGIVSNPNDLLCG
jgi:hypothetical protein